MIVHSVHNSWDTVYNSRRQTIYKTLEDPVTHKKVIEVVAHLYDKTGQVESANTKGRHIDKKV